MSVFSSTVVLLLVFELGECSKQVVFRKKMQKYLKSHVIETKQAEFEFECGLLCARHGSCASVNYKTSGIGKGRCELNTNTHEDIEINLDDEEINLEFNHLVMIKPVRLKEEKAISAEARKIAVSQSCKQLFLQERSLPDAVYTLQKNSSSPPYEVFCHMTDISGCRGGGWTLVLKIHGNKNTFTCGSSLWSNKETFAKQDGLEGMTEKESKLASYWNTPFTKICLGMSYNGTRKWMTFDHSANSLYGVIADGQFRETNAGRAKWKSLIAVSSLQLNCNKEGFNVPFRPGYYMRIGIVANQENDCNTCDSWLAYGTRVNRKNCGNYASALADNGNKELVTFGYILVQ